MPLSSTQKYKRHHRETKKSDYEDVNILKTYLYTQKKNISLLEIIV